MPFAMDYIDCDCCFKNIVIVYINSRNQIYEEYKTDLYSSTDDGILCSFCINTCMDCHTNININNERCDVCFKKYILQSTCNNITKKLPYELITEILQYI
jgi:hypothetical protein